MFQMFCVLSTRKSADDAGSELSTDLEAWAADVIRVYVLQGVEGSEELTTFALVENDPGRVEPEEQVFRVVEEVRVREWRAGRAAIAAGLI